MSKRTRIIIMGIAALQVIIALGVVALPSVVEAMPSRYQFAIQERVPGSASLFEAVAGPTPSNLPAPAANGEAAVALPNISFATPEATALPSPTPTPTKAPVEAAIEESTPQPTVPPTETPTPEPTATLAPLPVSARIEGLVNIPQGFNNCGPANMTVVLNFYGLDTTQNEVAAYLKPNAEDRNVSPWQLSDYVNEQTSMRSTAHSGGTLELLKRLIAAGFPVVVEKGYDPTAAEGWYGHYLTVFGYDDEAQIFNAMDTYLGPFNPTGAVERYESMAELWQHFNYTFFVIYPPGRESELQAILGEDMLDAQQMWQNAALKAQEEIAADPENAFAWFNLGTSMTRLGELSGTQSYYQQGAEAFDTARTIGLPYRMLWYQFRPYIAYMKTGRYQDMIDLADATLTTPGGSNVEETYLYRGHANSFLGNISAAISDMERALELNPNFYPAQIALDSLRG